MDYPSCRKENSLFLCTYWGPVVRRDLPPLVCWFKCWSPLENPTWAVWAFLNPVKFVHKITHTSTPKTSSPMKCLSLCLHPQWLLISPRALTESTIMVHKGLCRSFYSQHWDPDNIGISIFLRHSRDFMCVVPWISMECFLPDTVSVQVFTQAMKVRPSLGIALKK